jgi:hypothetical protein
MVFLEDLLLTGWLVQLLMSFVKTTMTALWNLGEVVRCHASRSIQDPGQRHPFVNQVVDGEPSV